MTAETILIDVLSEVGLTETSPNIAGSALSMSQIRNFMNQAGKDIASRAEWSGLYKTDTTAGSVSSHDLPTDFQEMGEKGAIRLNKTGYQPVRPVLDPTMWDLVENRESAQPYYMIRDGAVKFAPALDSDGAKITYVSKNWVVGGKSAVTQNSDTFLIPERLIRGLTVVLWRREKGKPFDDYLAEFEANLATDIKANRGQG